VIDRYHPAVVTPVNGRSCIAIATSDAATRPLKISETVARDVVRDIIERGLRPGDNLPSEAAMLDVYGVSRESLREGLRLLEVQGLISIRRGPGGGPTVGTVDPGHLGRISTLYYHLAGATYRELLEAWVLGEAMLADRAARNPDVDARRAAMEPYLMHEPDAGGSVDDFVQSHAAFHAAVASLAQNRVLELTLQTYGQIVSHHSAVVGDPRQLREVIDHDHHELARAIVAGHARRANDLMRLHIDGVSTLHFDRLREQADDFIEWR
jgi:GntR family transcriptional repressor for pyruvate dehydrogenase complex